MGLTRAQVANERLHRSHLIGPRLATTEGVVRLLGAVQAQDYGAAKWAVAQRTAAPSGIDVDRALDEGTIIRTHVMRPTWHFVAAEDIRWLLELTSPRVRAANAYLHRRLGLHDDVFVRSNRALERALAGGQAMTRPELAVGLRAAGIDTDGLRLTALVMRAELDGVVCSGGRRGKQFAYSLLDERVPQGPALDRDAALARLAGRYFAGHGPAQVQDFSWWSGLTVADARAAVKMAGLASVDVAGQPYWWTGEALAPVPASPAVHLLPNYDEYVVAYRDHGIHFDRTLISREPGSYALLAHVVVLDGQVIGHWRPSVEKDEVTVALSLLVSLTASQRTALELAAEDYGRFVGKPVRLVPDDRAGRFQA